MKLVNILMYLNINKISRIVLQDANSIRLLKSEGFKFLYSFKN